MDARRSSIRAARAMLSSGRKVISGARRRRRARPTRARKCVATLARPSKVCARSASVPITLTNTFAWRRSRVTSQPVTVTSFETRGSFASLARNVATSSRMASATRSARRCSVMIPRVHHLASGRRDGRLERPGDVLRAIALDDVTLLHVIEVLDLDTALEALAHFPHVVLEALERRDRAVEDLDAVADDPHAALTIDHAAADRAARDRA